jgi:serine phosphatase RsbU (regulator of sigma subunit)
MSFVICNCGLLLTFTIAYSATQIKKLYLFEDTLYHYILYSVLVISFVYFLVRSQTRNLIKTRKALEEKEQALLQIEKQRSELEIINKNIRDSLVYAKRIQEALLPSEAYFRKHFEDSFIFLKPKDIVSGDFCWIGEKGNKLFVVAADCTGHGVPGALMSMIGHEILDKTINDNNIEQPARILGILNKELEKIFRGEKNIGTIIRDGMDIGLCVVDKKRKKMEYAGALFPLYIIRENSLIEVKGDKHIIGLNPSGTPYTNHNLDIQDNDIVYMFSDGYADQFGGTENKKFMYRRLRYLLMTIHKFPLQDQKTILDENIMAWMGNSTQIDDIMVIGFKPL